MWKNGGKTSEQEWQRKAIRTIFFSYPDLSIQKVIYEGTDVEDASALHKNFDLLKTYPMLYSMMSLKVTISF